MDARLGVIIDVTQNYDLPDNNLRCEKNKKKKQKPFREIADIQTGGREYK